MMWMFASRRKFRLLAICNADRKGVEVNIVSFHDVVEKVHIRRVFREESGFGRIIRVLTRKRDLASNGVPVERPTATWHATRGGGGGGVREAGGGVGSPKYQLAIRDGYC
jgi:hypothetical protein